jgi:hypothetical protein
MMDKDLWANRQWLLELILNESKESRAWHIDWVKIEIDVVTRIVTLAVAIVGLVVPILTTRPNLANLRWLVVASLLALVVICVGVLRLWVLRVAINAAVHRDGKYYGATVKAWADNMTDIAAAQKEFERLTKEHSPDEETYMRGFGITVVIDCLLYGPMLLSLVCLMAALWKR